MKRLAALLALSCATPTLGQSPYLYTPPKSSNVEDNEAIADNCLVPRPISDWLDQKVVFAARLKPLQQYGYQSYTIEGKFAVSPSYLDLVGKVATINAIGEPDATGFRIVRLSVDGTALKLKTHSLKDTLSGVTLLSEIQKARDLWVGKTLWYVGDRAREAQDQSTFEARRIRKYQPLKILEVLVGTDLEGATDFVGQLSDGSRVVVPITISTSNINRDTIEIYKSFGRSGCTFDETFLISDPRLTNTWPKAIWDSIEAGKASIGMTASQVIMALGHPEDINDTVSATTRHSQWVYPNHRYVYFGNSGSVTDLQE